MTSRQWMALAGLTLSAFMLNTSEFMPIGLLTDIASGFGIAEAAAGVMITVYAWAVMLLSLPLMIAASRIEFKRLLLGVLAVFAVGQALSAFAPTFAILVVARIVVACAHAIFWSIAMIFGMPLGRAIGLALGWRMAFGVVGAVLRSWPSTLLSSCLRCRRASPSPSASCRRSCEIAALRPCMR